MDAVAVIRAAGERTEDLCYRLVRKQFPVMNVLHVRPFAAAVRQCFNLGIASGAEWLVTVDADVLIAPDYRERIAPLAAASTAWQLLGKMDDKLWGGVRQGGVRLYRVSALHDLLARGVRDDAVRPEADLCARVPGWQEVDVVTGAHDFEQFYRDLYRKGQQHRAKHPGWASLAREGWRESKDRDLQAAWAGWCGGALKFTEKQPLE